MYIIVILNAQCNIYAFMAGFVVCLHTLNLGKDYEPYISVVVFRKITSPVYFIGSQRVSYLWTNITCGLTI